MKNKILQMIEDFRSMTDKYPKNIYVGHADWQLIRAEMSRGDIYLQDQSQAMRPRCLGLWVYQVDAHEHLNVG